MKFGCNYSAGLMDLMEMEKIKIDHVKMGYFGPFMGLHDMVSRRCPILIHGFGWHEHIGMVSPEVNNDWQLMNNVIERYDNDALVVHFSVYEKDMIGRSTPREVLEDGIRSFINGSNRPLMIENMDHNPMYNRLCTLKESVEPAYITEICEKFDLPFLLDTAHASVSAWHLGMDIYDYMDGLPLDRVKEVHLIGSQLTEDQGLKDTHTVLEDRDYQLMDWLMARMKPEIITLEYGWPGNDFKWRTDEGAIYEQLTEIRRRYNED